jgi:phage terminase large subunit
LATVRIPNGWQPRPYQRPLWDYLEGGGKRAVAVWHRRAGKDDVLLHRAAVSSFERVGNRWHMLPEYAQARKAIWSAVNPHTGKRRIDEAFPEAIRAATNEQEMFIRFLNGSTWQLVGSDRYDSLVGSGVVEVTFSEWALANPSAWAYIRPMLEENNGTASFITTPRGNNHAKTLLEYARTQKGWFSEVLSVRDTKALSEEQIAEALAEYQALYGADFGLAKFEQEYECSFSGAMIGAYWGGDLSKLERDGRASVAVDIDPSEPVHTAWDLGKAVNNPIWCFQVIGGRLRIVDFYKPEHDDLEEWCRWLNDRGYTGDDYVPDDIMDFIWGAKHTRWDLLKAKGRKPKLVKRIAVADGIHAGREAIKLASFHAGTDERAERVAFGFNGLKNYRRAWDDELKTYRETPVKDWAEHIGSSWRYLGLAWRAVVPPVPKETKPKELEYTATPTGLIQGNMDVRAAVEAMVRRRRGDS